MTRKDHFVFFVILMIASLLRFQDIQQPLFDAFSWRESSTAMMADNFYTRSWNIFFPEVSLTGSDPGYQGREFAIVSYITAIIYYFVGWQDWIGRLVAATFGLWTVFALHRLIFRVWGLEYAHAGALVYALLPGAVQIDSSFLPDPAMLALITSGTLLFVKYLQEGRSWLLPVSTALFTLGVLAKLPGIAAALPIFYCMVCWFLANPENRYHQLLPVISAAVISLALVYSYYAWAVHVGETYPPYHVAGSGYIWRDGIGRFAGEYFYLASTWRTATAWYVTGPILFLSGVGLMSSPPRVGKANELRINWMFHYWFAGAAVVYLMAAKEVSVNVWNYHIFSVPIAAFAGRGLHMVVTGGRQFVWPWTLARVAVVSAVVLFVGTLPGLKLMKRPYATAGYELGKELNLLSQPHDYVIAISPQVGDPVAIYYSRRRGWVFPPGGGQFDWSKFVDNVQAKAQLEKLKASGAKWFGVTKNARDSRGRSFFDHHQELISYLDTTAERVVDNEVYVIYRL